MNAGLSALPTNGMFSAQCAPGCRGFHTRWSSESAAVFLKAMEGLLAASAGYDRWFRFAVPGALLVAVVGAAGIMLAQ